MQSRIVDEVWIRWGLALAPEAVQPILDVGGIARLRHLSVVDHIDPGSRLAAHDLGDSFANAPGKRFGLHRDSFLFREHHADQIFGTRQAARMRGQEAVITAFHGSYSL